MRTVNQALDWARAQSTLASADDWAGYCLRFVRMAYDIPPLFRSAWLAWLGADPDDRHPGRNPAAAPVGAALCYRGSRYGHIMLAARPAHDGTPMAWSNDLARHGRIDYVPRSAPESRWGQTYVGWLSAVNQVDLGLVTDRPRRYPDINRAIRHLQAALAAERATGDRADRRALLRELTHLRALAKTVHQGVQNV